MGSGYLPKDSAARLRSTIESLEDAMVRMGYVPLGYVSIAALKDQLEHDASTDPIGHVSDWKVVFVLRLLLKKEEFARRVLILFITNSFEKPPSCSK